MIDFTVRTLTKRKASATKTKALLFAVSLLFMVPCPAGDTDCKDKNGHPEKPPPSYESIYGGINDTSDQGTPDAEGVRDTIQPAVTEIAPCFISNESGSNQFVDFKYPGDPKKYRPGDYIEVITSISYVDADFQRTDRLPSECLKVMGIPQRCSGQ